MSAASAINPLLRRIDALGAAHAPPLTRYAIAKRAGIDEGAIRKLEQRPNGGVNATTLRKLAAALEVRVEDLMADETSGAPSAAARAALDADLPLLGAAAGAAAASFTLGEAPIDWLPRPPALRRVRGAYAVYVENDSMAPMHARGDLRFVDPNKPARPGDSVIVQTLDARGERQAWIKLLDKRVDGWLVCRQLNPAAEVRYKADNVVSLHRVLTTAELFNR